MPAEVGVMGGYSMGAESCDPDEQETTVLARPPASGVHPSLAPDARPSGWARIRAFFERFADWVSEAVREPRLSDRLPPIPVPRPASATQISAGAVARDERGELLLLEILRAPHTYQLGAVDVARYGMALRRLGDDAYAEGVVHFVLSRIRPDRDGTVAITRLRDILCDMPFSGVLVPALRRLEGHGIVSLTWSSSGQLDRIELRVQL
jgi:hypothetical protein